MPPQPWLPLAGSPSEAAISWSRAQTVRGSRRQVCICRRVQRGCAYCLQLEITTKCVLVPPSTLTEVTLRPPEPSPKVALTDFSTVPTAPHRARDGDHHRQGYVGREEPWPTDSHSQVHLGSDSENREQHHHPHNRTAIWVTPAFGVLSACHCQAQ